MAALDETRLKSMGIDTKVGNFLFYDNKWAQYFEWMLANTTDDNIYTDNELSEISALKDDHQYLNSYQVEEALTELNALYPGIISYTATDEKFAKRKLEELNRMESLRRGHYSQAVNLQDRLEQEISALEEELQIQKEIENEVFKTTLEQAFYLETSRAQRKTAFQEMQRLVNEKSPILPVFMYQMPLQNYNDSVDLFLKQVDIFVMKNFGKRDKNTSLMNDRTQAQIENLKNKWAVLEETYMDTRLDIEGRANIVKMMQDRSFEAMLEGHTESFLQDLRCRNATMEAEFDSYKFENMTLMKKAIQAEFDLMLFKRYDAKKTRAMQDLKLMQSVREVSGGVLNEAELIWMFLKIDLEKFGQHLKSIQSVVAGEFERKSDHSALAVISKRNPNEPKEEFESRVLELQKQYLSENFFMTRNLFEVTEDIHKSVKSALLDMKSAKHIQSFFTEYSKLKSLEKTLTSFVFDGSLSSPYLVDNIIMLSIAQKKQKKESMEKSIRLLMQTFEAKYLNRRKKDELWAAKQMLWVWFMADKRRAVMALSEVSRLAKTTPAYAKFNPTMG